jgi:hypothetical protein
VPAQHPPDSGVASTGKYYSFDAVAMAAAPSASELRNASRGRRNIPPDEDLRN